MEAVMLRSAFCATPLVALQSPVAAARGGRRAGGAAVGPRRGWSAVATPAVESADSESGRAVASRLLEQLERKAREVAVIAAERVLHSEDTEWTKRGFLSQQHNRLQEWWTDHLALRANAVEAAFGQGEEEVHTEGELPIRVYGLREAEVDKSRDALREFYYPRSDPGNFN